jgi:hypothetical protein
MNSEAHMQRRDFVTSALVGGLVTSVVGDGRVAANDQEGHHHGKRDPRNTNYTVSFGHWLPTPTNTPIPTERPIDRFLLPTDPSQDLRFLNGHDVLPNNLRIRVGDSVTFAISGFHLLLIYKNRKPEQIDRTDLIFSPPMTFPPLINDEQNRLYRGLDPRANPANQDRLEVVGFHTRGRYLVMCGVLPHFFDPVLQEFVMFGYIDVRFD